MNNNSSVFDLYLEDIKNIPILSKKEEFELSQQIQIGDKEAFDKLVKHNLRFVLSIAMKYQGRGLSLSDLVAEGNVGLLSAAQKFDPKFRVKFISYAVWWVRQRILLALSEMRIVAVPLNLTHYRRLITLTQEEYSNTYGRKISPKSLAKVLGIRSEVVEILAYEYNEVSFNQPLRFTKSGESGRELIDDYPSDDLDPELACIASEEELFRQKRNKLLFDLIYSVDVSNKKKVMYIMYHGLDGNETPPSLEMIGAIYGITRERVRQIRNDVHKKLIKKIESEPESVQRILRGEFSANAPTKTKHRDDVDQFLLFVIRTCNMSYKHVQPFIEMSFRAWQKALAIFFLRKEFRMSSYEVSLYFKCLVKEVDSANERIQKAFQSGTMTRAQKQAMNELMMYFITDRSRQDIA